MIPFTYDEIFVHRKATAVEAAGTTALEVVDNTELTGSSLAFFPTPAPGFFCLSTRGRTDAFGSGGGENEN